MQQGRITEWNDDRGFGFITPLGDGPRAFVHISEFPRTDRRPIALDLVTYEAAHDEKGRLRASSVNFMTPVRARSVAPEATSGTGIEKPQVFGVAAAFLGIVGVLALTGTVPGTVFWVDLGISIALFVTYATDKSAAQRGAWRTSEASLHLLALLGGWPGALVAQQVFRHKTKKQPFRTIFWLTVVGNCASLFGLAWVSGAVG